MFAQHKYIKKFKYILIYLILMKLLSVIIVKHIFAIYTFSYILSYLFSDL